MPKVSEKFGGAYLKAAHLNGQACIFIIDGVNTEMIRGEDCYVLYFAGEKRGLKLSPTCARDVAEALGKDEMFDWKGGAVELYSVDLTITDRDTQEEKQVTMIRARAPAPGTVATLAPPPTTTPRSPTTDREAEFRNPSRKI